MAKFSESQANQAKVEEGKKNRSKGCNILSIGSVGSILSIGCSGSILSIGSNGSILSIGSSGSMLSIGSILSVGSMFSAGSVFSIFSFLSVGKYKSAFNGKKVKLQLPKPLPKQFKAMKLKLPVKAS
jgi:hypothetical protein